MAVVNKFNVNKEQVTLDADIIENMSANDVSYDDSTQYDENTVGDKLSELSQQVIYDVTANNNEATFASLSALLSSENLSTLIPISVRCGGMSVRFVRSSDNKYVQYRLMSDAFSATPADWQGVDEKPVPGSKNLVESEGVNATITKVINSDEIELNGIDFSNTGRYINANYDSSDNTWKTSDLICVVPNSQVKCYTSSNSNYNTNIISFFDKNKTYLSCVKGNSTIDIAEYTATAPSDAWYVAFTKNISNSTYSNASYYDITYQNISSATLKNLLNVLNGRITGNDSLIAKINDVLELSFSFDISNGGGKYFNASGDIKDSGPYSISDVIPMKKGDVLSVSTNITDSYIAIIVSCDSNGDNRTSLVVGDSTKNYSYTATKDEYVRICVYTSNHSVSMFKSSVVINIKNDISDIQSNVITINNSLGISGQTVTPEFTENTGKLIKFDDGSIGTSGPYSYTSPILLGKGKKIVSTCAATTIVSAITKCDANGDNRVPLVQALTDSASNDYTYINISGKDEYVILSFRSDLSHSAKIYNSNAIETVNAQIDNINNEIDEINDKINNADENIGISVLDFCKFANTCICVGDSVTEGHIYDYPRTPTWGAANQALSYPAALQKLTGWEVTNAGKSGYTATLWYYGSDAQHPAQVGLYDFSDYNICIIEFGYNASLTDTLDTDVDPYDNYEDFANTETGNYCRIIAKALSQNPNIFIVLNISPYLDKLSTRVGTSDVIKKISAKYGLPVIDLGKNTLLNLNDNRFHGSTDGTDVNIIHMNAIGYFAKGTVVKKYLDKYFDEYASKYNLIKYE